MEYPMRKAHIYLIGVAVATLGVVAAVPSAAAIQDEGAEEGAPSVPGAPELTPDQQTEFDSWPVERQTEYELWPAETKSYYWSLEMERQALFWRLTDQDKIALTAMTGPERDAAWEQIETRAATPPPEG